MLIHQSNENILFNEVKTIYYPIDIQEVQKQFKKNYSHEYYYKNILLLNNDILKSKKSKKMVNLTEIEATVLRLLINKKKIDKEKLNFLALSQKKGVESKSLESHLSRLCQPLYHLYKYNKSDLSLVTKRTDLRNNNNLSSSYWWQYDGIFDGIYHQ